MSPKMQQKDEISLPECHSLNEKSYVPNFNEHVIKEDHQGGNLNKQSPFTEIKA